MIKKFHIPRDLSTHAGGRRLTGLQMSFWRSVCMALALALTIGSAGQPVLAQVIDPDVSVETEMETSIPKDICVGEVGSIRVRVVRILTEIATNWKVRIYRKEGITVSATVKDAGIVNVLQPNQLIGFDFDLLGEVEFDMRGEKVGTTTIDFKAPVSRLPGEAFVNNARSYDNYVDITVSVKVISCDFQFTALSTFQAPGIKVHAVINKLVLTADAQGQYIRTVTVHWAGSWATDRFVAGSETLTCKHTFSAPDSEANLTGEINDSGVLVLFLSFQESSGLWNIDCGGPVKSQDKIKLNPGVYQGPLRIDVPVSSGFDNTLHQDIETLAGEALIVVVPQHTGSSQ